jgi:hypothetical protein
MLLPLFVAVGATNREEVIDSVVTGYRWLPNIRREAHKVEITNLKQFHTGPKIKKGYNYNLNH